jgi:flagellum-specific peptidoglycan hydrolase FlgJ
MTYLENAKNVSNISASGTQKIKKQQNYIKRFAEVARSEMRKYGIPASITLAQGLIESNAGDSRLSKENNNHFGMKCFSKTCNKGHCANFTDDSHKDFFRIYETAWESYRAHSIMLGGDRYKHLKNLKKSDYKGWAIGLQKAGYATDKRYAEKLIHIIEEMQLYQFDF